MVCKLSAGRKLCFLLLSVFVLLLLVLAGCERGPNVVKIEYWYPDGTTERGTNITIQFNQPMVNESVVGQLLDSAAIKTEPEIPGRFKWLDEQTIQLMPEELLAPATEYNIEILPGILPSPEKVLGKPKEFSFQTVNLRIVNYSPIVRPVPGDPTYATAEIQLRFNEVISVEDFKKNVSLELKESEYAGEIKWEIQNTEPSDVFRIKTEAIYREQGVDSRLEFKIGKDLAPIDGSIPLGIDYVKSISITGRELMKIRYVGAKQNGKKMAIVIDTSSPVHIATTGDYIDVEPDAEYDIIQERAGRIKLSGNFESEETYLVTIRKGLRSMDGVRMLKEYTQNVYIPPFDPTISFTSAGSYLSKNGLKNVELEMINQDEIHIEVQKIYINNLVPYLHSNPRSRRGYSRYRSSYRGSYKLGHRIYEHDEPVDVDRNTFKTTTINFESFLKDHEYGLFNISVRGKSRYWRYDSKSVMVTDIGLVAKRTDEELHVWAISTETLNPLGNVKVKLISNSNQVIKQGYTNQNGLVVLRGISESITEFTPYVITAEKGKDFSYLHFSEAMIAKSDFDIDGLPNLKKGHEAFLYGDRGVYRPGESAYITTIVRGKNYSIPNDFPVRLEIRNPDGKLFLEQRGRLDNQGMCEFKFEIPGYARTGRYNAKLYGSSDNPINTYTFSVEEFMPDRIKTTVSTDKETYSSGDKMMINVQGKMLFGPPADGRKFKVKSWFEPQPFNPADYPKYSFKNPFGKISDIDKDLGSGELDENGEASIEYDLPVGIRPPSSLRLIVEASVFEKGGRAVTNRSWATVHPYPFYIGIKRENESYANINRDEKFKWVVLTPEGQPVKTEGLVARLNHIRYQSILEIDENGRRRYKSERYPSVIQTFNLDEAESGEFSFQATNYGEYEVQIEHEESGTITGVRFRASGWGYAPWSMEHPDRIDLELDKDQYGPGDVAQVLVKAPISGQLLLTVERDKVLYSSMHRMSDNTAKISLPIREGFGTNAYVTAVLVRTPHDGDQHSPMSAFGIVPISMDNNKKLANLSLNTPSTAIPGETLDVTLSVPGAPNTAKVTIAAVDEGILQLTEFKTPDPSGFFYGKRRLEVDTYDIFSLLMPEVEPAEANSSPSGDRALRRRSHLNTMSMARVKPVALWSGILPVRNGLVKHKFDIPEFNGQLRVMAVAVSGDKFGFVDSDVTVRSPIVLTPYFPRFVSGHDKITTPVSVYNSTGKDGEFTVKLDIEGPIKVDGEASYTIDLKAGEEKEISFDLTAEVANKLATLTLTVNGNGKKARKITRIPVRPPTPPHSESGNGSIKAGSKKRIKFKDDWIKNTAYYSLHCMSMPQIEFGRSLQYLLRYPHGCLEQTTSKAFPLLYFEDLAKVVEPDRFKENAPEYYIEEAIGKIVSMQEYGGYFTFWPRGGRINPWASTYALHFLVEASELDYSVPGKVLEKGERYLRHVVKAEKRSGSSYRYGGVYSEDQWLSWNEKHILNTQAYALFLLAKMDSPDQGAMHRLLEVHKDKLPFSSKMLLAGAFMYAGDVKTAASLLPKSPPPDVHVNRITGRTFDSNVRSDAICLYVLQEIDPENILIPLLTKSLNKRFNNRYSFNTQEAAWFFLAFGKLARDSGGSGYHGNLRIDGELVAEISTEPFSYIDSTMGEKDVEIDITGHGRCYYFWEARGIPEKLQLKDVSEGITLSRRYLTPEGGVISLEDVPQGELVVAQITIEADNFTQNVIVNDLLPAGFEIENPRLESREQMKNLPTSSMDVAHMDIRDDRLLIYTYLLAGNELTYHYVLRSVTAGTFVLPPITAESMYDPSIRGSSSSGYITVKR